MYKAADTKLKEFYKNKRVLVTGGAGFIGSHITEALINFGAKVTVLDNLSTGNLENLQSNIEFIKGDITNLQECLQATQNKQVIFHLAAFISVPDSMNNPSECNKINVTGTFNLLEACRINKVEKLIFSSSAAVYGKTEIPCNEDMKADPISVYGFSKLMGEEYCKQYSKLFNIQTICLRYFNVFGPRQSPNGQYAGVVAKFNECIKNNKPITIYGDGSQTRDYISAQEVALINIKMATLAPEHLNGQTVNVATGSSITLLELVDKLKKEQQSYSQAINFLPARVGDIKNSKADCNKLKSYMNF